LVALPRINLHSLLYREIFHTEERGGHYVLLKPFSPERLLALVQQLARVAQMKHTVSTLSDAQSGRIHR